MRNNHLPHQAAQPGIAMSQPQPRSTAPSVSTTGGRPARATGDVEMMDVSSPPPEQPSDEFKLTSQQQKALLEITAGHSVTQAAITAGVHRGTLHRWLRENSAFAAAHNAWQTEVLESARTRLMRLADNAVDVVCDSLEKGDARTALTILKQFCILHPISPGTTSAEELKREREIEQKKREAKLLEDEFDLKLGMFG